MFLSFWSTLSFQLELVLLHFDFGKFGSEFVELRIDLDLAEILSSDLVALSLNQHFFLDFEFFGAICQQSYFILSFS